jgi:hypothetical protein
MPRPNKPDPVGEPTFMSHIPGCRPCDEPPHSYSWTYSSDD